MRLEVLLAGKAIKQCRQLIIVEKVDGDRPLSGGDVTLDGDLGLQCSLQAIGMTPGLLILLMGLTGN